MQSPNSFKHRPLNVWSIALPLTIGLAALALCAPPTPASGAPARRPGIHDTPTPAAPAPAARVGVLVLQVSQAPAEAWEVVQWQDGQGRWNDVEGWRGKLEASGQVTYWVDQADLGKGVFRWVVYDRQGGTVWGISEGFYLPKQASDSVLVQVTATAKANSLPASVSAGPLAEQSTCTPSYMVQHDDTLLSITQQASTTVEELSRLNPLTNMNQIYPGLVLHIPAGPAYVVKPGDTLSSIARRAGTTSAELARLNMLPNMNWIIAGQVLRLSGPSECQ
jgi:LysM repeat protein